MLILKNATKNAQTNTFSKFHMILLLSVHSKGVNGDVGFFRILYQSAFEPKSGPHNTLVWRKKPSSFWTKKCVMRIWMGMELSVWVVGGCTRKSGPAKLVVVVFWEVAVNICMACCVKESVKDFRPPIQRAHRFPIDPRGHLQEVEEVLGWQTVFHW